MSRTKLKAIRRSKRTAKRTAAGLKLSPEQKAVLDSFTFADTVIKQITVPIEQGVMLAQAFGRLARSVDYLMQTHAGLDPMAKFKDKPKLEVVADKPETVQ